MRKISFYKKKKVCHICKKRFSTDDNDNKNYDKVTDNSHYTGKYILAVLIMVLHMIIIL